jgi:hypothetical protein
MLEAACIPGGDLSTCPFDLTGNSPSGPYYRNPARPAGRIRFFRHGIVLSESEFPGLAGFDPFRRGKKQPAEKARARNDLEAGQTPYLHTYRETGSNGENHGKRGKAPPTPPHAVRGLETRQP